MTQTLTEMESAVASGGDKLGKFAEISGMSSEQFAEAWKNEPIVAIQAFIEGLGKLDEQGESATLVLEEMGLSGVRQGNMLKSLATASDLLGNAVGLANTAWAENTALMTEANTRYQTTESKITMFKNSVNNLKIAIGDQLTPAIGDLAVKGTDVVEWATDFANKNEWLAPTISAVAASMSVLLGFITTATVVIPVLTKLVEALNSSFLKSPTALVAMGIAAVTAAVVTLVATLPDASEEVKDLRDAMDKLADTMDDAEETHASTTQEIKSTSKVLEAYITRLEELEKQSSLTDEEQKEYNRLVGEIKRIMPDANTAIDENTKKLKDGASALRENVEEWKNMALAAADNARVEAMQQALTNAYVAMNTAQDNLTVATHNANDQVLNYATALQELYAVQADYNAILGDSSATVEDIEAATNRMADANIKASDAKRGLCKEEKEQAEEIAALKSELESATQAAADYEKRIEVLNGPLKEMGEASQKTADGIERTTEATAKAGETSGEAITEGFSDSLQMGEATTTEMAEVEEAITSSGETIVASAEDIGTQAASTFQEGLSTAQDAATQVMSDVNQAVRLSATEARGAGYSVGAAISQGAAAGVRDYAAQVAAEAAQMVRNAINAANRAAQINSPSKLTRKTGRGLDEGIIVGINELKDDVISTMEDTMHKVASVQVDIPVIPDRTPAIHNAITAGSGSSDLGAVVSRLDKIGKRLNVERKVDVVQNIYAKDTSYRGQQREAKRRMRELSRELSR